VSSATPKGFDAVDPLDGTLANDPMDYLECLFVFFLQNIFRDTFVEGSGLRWQPDEEETEVIITSEKPTLEAVGKVPHIACVFGACRWAGIGLDQLQSLNMNTGQRQHTDLVPSTVTYHCLAKLGPVARRLAWNASYYTNVFRRALMSQVGIHHVGVRHDISSEGPARAYTGPLVSEEVVEVTVTVPFFWQPQWRARPYAEVFQSIKITLRAHARGLYSAGRAMISPPSIYGRILSPPTLEQEVVVDQDEEE
jgi:hypothetical protein